MMAARSFAACGIHARNLHMCIPPYSYGLAAHVTTIYNALACSGGQGVRSSQRALPLEATRPGLLGTPGLVYSWTWICRSSRSPRNSRAGRPLTQQPVDDAGRCAGQAERQRHAHQDLVAIELGWWRAQRGSSRSAVSIHEIGKRVEGVLFPISGNSGPFCAVSVSLTLGRHGQPSAVLIKIVVIQWFFKIFLS